MNICFTDWWVSSLFWVVACLVVLVVLARGLHPVSFPNLEVKPFCADGTATGGLWESRALPTVFLCGGGVWSCCGVGTPTTFFLRVCGVVCVEGVSPLIRLVFRVVCGVGCVLGLVLFLLKTHTQTFVCVRGTLVLKGSQRHAYR